MLVASLYASRFRYVFGVVTALAFVLTMLLPRVASADPMRILIAVGNKAGLPNERPLKHSQNDAARVRDVMTRLGGVKPEHAILVQEATPEALAVAVDRAALLAKSQPAAQVTLFFYFSGHGDHDAIHLGARVVPLKDIDTALARVPARFRLFISDACRNDSQVRAKGFSSEDPFPIRLDATGASGAVWLHASADGEVAQESDELGGAVFTYYLVSGMAGAADTNGDGRVTLSESYSYAYSQTLLRTARASGVVQRPSADFNVHEGAPVVLTELLQTSLLRFPKSADAHYIVYGHGSRTVVGDLYGSADRTVALALPQGRYIVHRRAGGTSGAAEISLGSREERALEPTDFRAVKEELLARKGGEVDLEPNELSVGFGASTSRMVDFGQALHLRYTRNFEEFSISAGAEGGIGRAEATADLQSAQLRWLGLEALLEFRFKVGDPSIRLGVGPVGRYYSQTLTRSDANRLTTTPYPGERSFSALAGGGQALVGIRIPLGTPKVFLGIHAIGELLGVKLEGSIAPFWAASANIEGGFRF